MGNLLVRILDIQIKNIKNVVYGDIEFRNRMKIKEKRGIEGVDILGVYGQNGSGKTALIDAINIASTLLQGKALEEEVKELILEGTQECTIEVSFYIEDKNNKYIANYQVTIALYKDCLIVSKEKLSCSFMIKGKWKIKTLIDYTCSEEKYFEPAYRFKEIKCKEKELRNKLRVARELSKREATSFIFSKETMELLTNTIDKTHISNVVIKVLNNFARTDLYVIRNSESSDYNIRQIISSCIGFNWKEDLILEDSGLFECFVASEEAYLLLKNKLMQLNIVISAIIPGLIIKTNKFGRKYLDNGSVGVVFEILAVRDGQSIPLRKESNGVKKIISIISVVIAMYNNAQVCLVIDDFDRGIFEYLFGELLEVISKGTKGQMIFTAHNLRAFEVLNKEYIVCTTTNPEHKYCRLKNIKKNSNLRDFYLRSILLGGQKEELYKETNIYQIALALRKANNEIKN